MAPALQGKLSPDLFRTLSLASLDEGFRARGFTVLAGVDEAGRGPLAGPVVAAAVILPSGAVLKGVTDSKRLSPGARERLLETIFCAAVAIGIGIVESEEIDRINVLQASLLAMKKAVVRLRPTPDALLIDGPKGIHHHLPQFPIIRGDSKSQSIAAASIVAKVTRDRIMADYHASFPEYGFERNKGYATPEHLKALHTYGCSPIHRKTFRGVLALDEEDPKHTSFLKPIFR